jgi:hypothetical protein
MSFSSVLLMFRCVELLGLGDSGSVN